MGKKYFRDMGEAKEYVHTQADLIAHAYRRMKEIHNGALLMDAGKLYFLASKKLKEGRLLFLSANFLVIKIYSLDYSASVALLKVLSFIILVKSLSYVYNWFLSGSNEQKKVLVASGLASILNIILNYFLIIRYNAMGAIIATAITELFLLAVFYLYFKKKWHEIYNTDKI